MRELDSHRSVIDWAKELVREINDRADKSILDEFRLAIRNLESERFVLAVLGKAKRGKSTLLNVLLGRDDDTLAPVDKLPASSAVSRFRWAEKEIATAVLRDGNRQVIGLQQIRDFVTEELNPGNSKGVELVEIEGPFARLDKKLELVDTPGAASIHEHHDAILHSFIPQADAVIFLVTSRMPIDQDELDLLARVKSADIHKIFFAINRVDEASGSDLKAAIVHNQTLLVRNGIHVDKIHCISAKKAFRGDFEGSGSPELISVINSFLIANKSKFLRDRFISRVSALVRPIAMSLELEAASSAKSSIELQRDLASLQEKKRSIESERGFADREFRLAWTRAIDDFEEGVASAKTNVQSELSKKLKGTSLLDITKVARDLPTWLTSVIENQLSIVALKYENSTREICDRLQTTYPRLDLNQDGAISVRTKDGNELITGSIGGLAATATGLGVAAAGSAAAATIAAANVAALHATTTVLAPSALSGVLSMIGLSRSAELF
jgi:GTPase SAR1 family protein